MALLKWERVRWHPDMMEPRLAAVGAGGLEGEIKRKVKELFMIVQGLLRRDWLVRRSGQRG